MARRPLTIDEIDRMDREEILAWQEVRKEELAKEEELRREEEEKAHFEQRFLANGGDEADVDKEWKSYRREKAAAAARRADQAAIHHHTQSMRRAI